MGVKNKFIEGQIFMDGQDWVLDADPHVTILFERLFPASRIERVYENGGKTKFTHRPRYISDTPMVRKNIAWFLQRFSLEISPNLKQRLEIGARRYDRTVEKQRNILESSRKIPLEFALPLRDYQNQAVALGLERGGLLVADQVGLGKTPIGIAIGSQQLPCVCVVPPHLLTQWIQEIHKFLPKARVQKILPGKEKKLLLEADFYVVSYSMVSKYVELFLQKRQPRSIIMDEVQELRRDGTYKYEAVSALAERATHRIGLSATPIMNYGRELHNIFSIIDAEILGDTSSFMREWCVWGQIKDPELLGTYLRKNMLMVRRTRKEVNLEMEAVNRLVYTVDSDMAALKELEKEAKALAMTVITGDFISAGEAARQFDYRLRHATGVAKAKGVAEMVKMIVDSGEKVVLFGWHRDCWNIWLTELAAYRPVMYTGSETAKQKQESLREFVDGKAKVFLISLRSGSGINGLQFASSYAVFGELDWSPGIIDQCIGRLWRDGQKEQVTAMFITINDGADPIMKKVLGIKATEAKAIIEGEKISSALTTGNKERVLDMAKEYLKERGEDVDSMMYRREKERKGELLIDPPGEGMPGFEAFNLLNQHAFSFTDEVDMQDSISRILGKNGFDFKKEEKIGPNSRVDFLLDNEVIVECKVRGMNKRSLLRQIKRYIRDYQEKLKSIIVITPENINHFKIADIPVYAINISDSSLLISGLS